MGRIVRSEDFTDQELEEFLDRIERLDYTIDPGTPQWVEHEAESYSQKNAKPTPRELRNYISHAVQSSMGWDDPHDSRKMLHAAVKAYYALDWIEHLHRHAKKAADVSIQTALKVKFTPIFKNPRLDSGKA